MTCKEFLNILKYNLERESEFQDKDTVVSIKANDEIGTAKVETIIEGKVHLVEVFVRDHGIIDRAI